jgi:uncharacterized protein with HEPN domain
MPDPVLLKEILIQIKNASEKIMRRIEFIKSPDAFYFSDETLDKLDAICMSLIAIGESIKKFDKLTEEKIFRKYPEVDWKGLKGIRDVISHQYFDLNADAVFYTCKNDVPILIKTLILLIKEFE